MSRYTYTHEVIDHHNREKHLEQKPSNIHPEFLLLLATITYTVADNIYPSLCVPELLS